MCGGVMMHKELFEEYFKVDMLSLASDKVPNVRLALARVLNNHFKRLGSVFDHDKFVNDCVKVLRDDKDPDVRIMVSEI